MRQLKTVLEGILAGQDDVMQAGDDFQNAINTELSAFYTACSNKSNFIKGETQYGPTYKFVATAQELLKILGIESKNASLRLFVKYIEEENIEDSYWMVELQYVDEHNHVCRGPFRSFHISKAKTINTLLKKCVQPMFKDLKSFETVFIKK